MRYLASAESDITGKALMRDWINRIWTRAFKGRGRGFSSEET